MCLVYHVRAFKIIIEKPQLGKYKIHTYAHVV